MKFQSSLWFLIVQYPVLLCGTDRFCRNLVYFRNSYSDMAEGLGVAANIIALPQANQIVITYVREVKGADEERNNILNEATNLDDFQHVLNNKVPSWVQPACSKCSDSKRQTAH